MCGIAGSVNFLPNEGLINKVMGHRGPDERSTYTYNNVYLHHLRLSILDSFGGKQPMHLDDRYTIIFNGEIYNHLDLRKKFNIECETKSDTETVLKLYEKVGTSFLNDIDGMYAFAILDKKNNNIFLARDRAGKKPLYYYKSGKVFLFASELNAIREFIEPQINHTEIANFLHTGVFYKESTPYKDVFEFPAGSYATISLSSLNLEITNWWKISKFYAMPSNDTFDEALQHVDELLHKAIKSRIDSSDLEVGTFLSGGIDSGLVTAIATKYNSDIKTFTVSFPDSFDEAPLAKLVANKCHTKHTEIHIGFDNLLFDVEKILANYGEPFCDSSAIPSYYVSQEAKKYLTVILNGDGADEIFAGYRRYVPFSKYNFFKNNLAVNSIASLIKPIIPLPKDKKSKLNYLHRLVSIASVKGINTYLSSTADIFEGLEDKFITPISVNKDLLADFNEINSTKGSGLQMLMNMDFDTILFSNLLVKMDIATMANSLEGRSPFLCKDLLEYVPTINDKYKINNNQTKYLLRVLAKKYLPDELINQPKRGFEIPLQNWVDGILKDMINAYLLDENSIARQYISFSFIKDLVENRVTISQEKRAKIIWTIFTLEVWYKKVFLKN